MKKVFLSCITLGVVVAGLITAGASSAAGPNESANGHGTVTRLDGDGNEVKRQFSFSAHRQKNGTVQGNAVLRNPAFQGVDGKDYYMHMDVTCMKVVGNIAIFGGLVRKTNDPNLTGAAFFQVEDNGEPGKGTDRISGVAFWDDDPDTVGDPQACLLTDAGDFGFEPIDSGNIQVRP